MPSPTGAGWVIALSSSSIDLSEPVWPSGEALGEVPRFESALGSPFSSKVEVCGHCLVTLFLTIYDTLKWLSSLPILMQESFWW